MTATDGHSEVEAAATFIQASAAEVAMSLRVEPSLVRVRDAAVGQLDITIDNRRGSRTRRIFLGGRDQERIVHFSFSPPSIDVLAGEVGRARVKVEAPPPPPGQESTRPITILASSEGVADMEAAATFVQSTAAAPVDVPLAIRLDPSVVRVRDTAVGQLEVVIDNRTGNRVRRVFLTGRDPERLVRFTFSPPSLDVLPGDIGRARVRLEAPLPDPGQEATRQVTVVVADGGKEIESIGTFVQTTSPKPVETPVALKLEPSLLRVRDTPTGQFQVIVDNRQGIRPRRITLAGTDPERALGFSFWPPVVEVGQGQVARSNGRVDGYPPEPGREVTRQFSVSASDGAKEVETDGTFIQSTSALPPDEPMTIRLEPSVVRVRNSGSGSTVVQVDNRGGSRPRRIQFGGHDPERVVRFTFDPPVLDLAPGQIGGVRANIAAPRPDGGEQSNRPFTVVASDGSRETETTGSFVQESSDWRPLWRILLTVRRCVADGRRMFPGVEHQCQPADPGRVRPAGRAEHHRTGVEFAGSRCRIGIGGAGCAVHRLAEQPRSVGVRGGGDHPAGCAGAVRPHRLQWSVDPTGRAGRRCRSGGIRRRRAIAAGHRKRRGRDLCDLRGLRDRFRRWAFRQTGQRLTPPSAGTAGRNGPI